MGTGSSAAVMIRAEPDEKRGVRVRRASRKRWKREIKKLPPFRREQWLRSQEAISQLGAKVCSEWYKKLEAERNELAAGAASSVWVDEWEFHEILPAGLEFNSQGQLVQSWCDGRRYAVRLVLGVCAVRNGQEHPAGTDPRTDAIAGPPSSRWTPPNAVGLEDMIDKLDWWEAARLSQTWPASSSADVLQRIRERRGTEREQKTKEVSRAKYKRAKAERERIAENRESGSHS